jgi:hypothetical protein
MANYVFWEASAQILRQTAPDIIIMKEAKAEAAITAALAEVAIDLPRCPSLYLA